MFLLLQIEPRQWIFPNIGYEPKQLMVETPSERSSNFRNCQGTASEKMFESSKVYRTGDLARLGEEGQER